MKRINREDNYIRTNNCIENNRSVQKIAFQRNYVKMKKYTNLYLFYLHY